MSIFQALFGSQKEEKSEEVIDAAVDTTPAKAETTEPDFGKMTLDEIAAHCAGEESAPAADVNTKLLAVLEKLGSKEAPKQDSAAPAIDWTEDNHGDILGSPTKLVAAIESKILDSLLSKLEKTLEDRDSVILKKISGVVTASESRRKFFRENADLAPHEEYVRFVADKLQNKYAHLPIDKFGHVVASTVRKQLKLTKETSPQEAGLPDAGASARSGEKGAPDKGTSLMEQLLA